jgi:hypothetical protein
MNNLPPSYINADPVVTFEFCHAIRADIRAVENNWIIGAPIRKTCTSTRSSVKRGSFNHLKIMLAFNAYRLAG